jgi:hypothetical protein
MLTFGFAAFWLFAHRAMLGLWQLGAGDPPTVYMARRFAGLFLGYAVLLWLARKEPPSRSTFAVCIAGATITGSSCMLSAYGALDGVAGAVAWAAALIEFAGFTTFSWLAWCCRRRLHRN